MSLIDRDVAPLLDIRNLAVEIGGRIALRDVSVEVETKTCVGLVGETGSGKSLTLRAVVGLLDRIDARIVRGSIRLDGQDLSALSYRDWQPIRGREIGFVPQGSFQALDPVMRIGRQLAETIRMLDPDADVSARTIELLEAVHLRPSVVRRLYAHELSGGMRQRVMIALALAGRPRLLLADEATTALDVTIQREILELLRELQDEADMALVFVTHDLSVVEALADRVVVTHAGVTVEAGPLDQVIAHPQHPYTRALLAASLRDATRNELLPTIAGSPPGLGEVVPGCTFVRRCPLAIPECSRQPPPARNVSPRHSVACIRAGVRET